MHVVHNTKYELFYNSRKECNNNHLKMLKLRLSSWLAVTGPVLGRLVSSRLPLHHRWQSRQREMAIALEKIQHEDSSFQVQLV